MIIIAPSILSANFASLREDIQKAEQAGADWIHVDVMDGHFVPNLTVGPQVVADIRKETRLFLDVHLMIEKPEQLVPAFAQAGADMITVHAEACTHLHRTIHMIKENGVRAGVALNPGTPAIVLENIIDNIEMILIMTVNPGFGGQNFIPAMVKKIKQVKAMLDKYNPSAYLQVDGGINEKTALEVVKAGCNVLVAGSYIFSSDNVNEAIRRLKKVRDS